MSELENETTSVKPRSRSARGKSGPSGGAAKPAARDAAQDKAAARKRSPARRSPPRKKSVSGAGSAAVLGAISAGERVRMISEAAYYKAEARGFLGGDPERDWLEAEIEVDALLLRERAKED